MRPHAIAGVFVVLVMGFAATVATTARAQTPSSATWENQRTVFMHIDSPEPVDLQRETGDKRYPFYVACASPCDAAVPADGEYRISGRSARPSRRFALPKEVARDTIVVEPASRNWFTLGVILIPVGGAAAGAGLWVLLVSSLSDSHDSRTLGQGLIGGGLAVVAGGIVLAVANAHSAIVQADGSIPRTSRRRWLDPMVWREANAEDRATTSFPHLPLVYGVF